MCTTAQLWWMAKCDWEDKLYALALNIQVSWMGSIFDNMDPAATSELDLRTIYKGDWRGLFEQRPKPEAAD